MVLDNEQQRKFLLEMFAQVSIPGTILEIAAEIKRAVVTAEVPPASAAVTGPPEGLPTLGAQE
jgi:hypothetical protein